jgi:hypothetical protein
MHRDPVLLGLVVLFAAGGCGAAPEAVPVQGRVVIAGQLADNISVQIVPVSAGDEPGVKASAVTDSAGKFTLRCEDGRGGAVPGRYHVLLEDLKVYANPRSDVPPDQRKNLIVSRVPRPYRAAGTTPLKITVEPKGAEAKVQEITLEVKP